MGISVIIPFHNAENTLEAAVRSLLGQTLLPQEIILVDDGSTDGSAGVAERLRTENCGFAAKESEAEHSAQEKPLIRILHMSDHGVSAARNAGMDAASGEYISFVDADDTADPRMLSVLMHMHEKSGADVCGCGFYTCRAKTRAAAEAGSPRTVAQGQNTEENAGRNGSDQDYSGRYDGQDSCAGKGGAPSFSVRAMDGLQFIRTRLLQHDTRVWGKLYAEKKLAGIRFKEGLTIGEDMLFLLELACVGASFASTDSELYGYRINPHGAMERPFTPSFMDQIRSWDLAEKMLQEKAPAVLADPESAGRLHAIQTVSAVLTASKISSLPKDSQPDSGTDTDAFWQMCVQTVREKTHGARAMAQMKPYLPAGYPLKIFLLRRAPGLYRAAYGRLRR